MVGLVPRGKNKVQINVSSFHCFTVYFNSLNIMSQQMHIYIIKH
jgi:hypothetical protein